MSCLGQGDDYAQLRAEQQQTQKQQEGVSPRVFVGAAVGGVSTGGQINQASANRQGFDSCKQNVCLAMREEARKLRKRAHDLDILADAAGLLSPEVEHALYEIYSERRRIV